MKYIMTLEFQGIFKDPQSILLITPLSMFYIAWLVNIIQSPYLLTGDPSSSQ